MSFAVHLFMKEKFSETSYREFLCKVQNIFGTWTMEGNSPVDVQSQSLYIHECWIVSEHPPQDENVRVNVMASRRLKGAVEWGFEYEWSLSLETSAGRSAVSLAVQLGGLLLAMETFDWFVVIDHDTCIKDEPTEFRSKGAVGQHIKLVIGQEFTGYRSDLKKRGILDEKGCFVLPQLRATEDGAR
jgi:hypothetical protein